jgi:lipid-A-disaccharide synthase
VAADTQKKEQLRSCHIIGFQTEYSICNVNETADWADLSIIASGSATLQVAAAGCPMVIMYQSSKPMWHMVGRWLINIKYLSLVNILAQKELVPEFMPYFDSIDPIFDAVIAELENRDGLIITSKELVDLTASLNTGPVSGKVAQIVTSLL